MEIKKTSKKQSLVCITMLILMFALGTFYYQHYIYNWVGYYTRWMPCLDYIKEGTLYAGQPYCESGGPPLFFIPFVIREIIGNTLFQSAMIVVSILIHLFTFSILWKMIRKEIPEQHWFLPGFLYIFLLYFTTITRFEAILTLAFFISGYYVLFYKEGKTKYVLGGILYGLAILSKPSVAVPIAFSIIGLYIKEGVILWKERKLKITIQTIKELCWLIMPGTVFVTLFHLKYKFFFIYYVLNLTEQGEAISYLTALKKIFILDVNHMHAMVVPLLATIIISGYFLWKEKKHYAWIAGPAQLVLLIMIVKSFGINHLGYHYWTMGTFFFIIVCCKLYKLAREQKNNVILMFLNTTLILIIIFPALYDSPLTHNNKYMTYTSFEQQRLTFIRQLHYPYQIIPEQDKVLFEHSEEGAKLFFYEYNVNIPLEKVELLTREISQGTPDGFSFPRYKELLGENLIYNPADPNILSEKEKEIIEKIKSGAYSFIHVGPPEWIATLRVLEAANATGYCRVIVPSNVWLTREGWHQAWFLFRKPEQCQQVFQQMFQYYTHNFNEICKQDKFSADMIKAGIEANGVAFSENCPEGENRMEYFKGREIYNKYLVAFTLSIIFLSLVVQYSMKRRELHYRERKTICWLLGIVLVASMIAWFFLQSMTW